MIRFLTTLVVTLAVAVAAAAWWTGSGDPEPVAIETGEASAAHPAPDLEPDASVLSASTTALPASTRALPEGVSPPEKAAPNTPRPKPVVRELPAIPPPRFATPPVRKLVAIPAPESTAPELTAAAPAEPEAATAPATVALPEEALTIEETELPTLPAFDAAGPPAPTTLEEILAADPNLEQTAEEELERWEEGQKTVALGNEHDASASRIRRLLDVYEGLRGRR